MIKKVLLVVTILLFAGSVSADPNPTKIWQDFVTPAKACINSNAKCTFIVAAGITSSGMFQVVGQGATVTMNQEGVTNGITYSIIRNVSANDTPTLAIDGQPFTGCTVQAADYCVLTPGQYWLEITLPGVPPFVGFLTLIGIP